MEKKLYEKKRMVAADMNEALGGLTRKEIEDRKKAGYKKASDVLPDPRDIKIKPLVTVKKKVKEAVEVQPDPEGRVRGGKAKRGLSPIQRRMARIGLGAIRTIEKQKKAAQTSGWSGLHQQTPSASQEPKRRKAEPATEPKKTEMPEKTPWVRRNVNTALGRDPDYDPKDPKNQSRGGRAGRAVRGIGKAIVSDLLAMAE